MRESWNPVPGYEGYYAVSDFGRVRSLDRVLNTVQGKRKWPGRIMSPVPDKLGRPVVNLRKGGRTKQWKVHRLVASAFIGPCPDGMEVCHGDGDNQNNHVSNLRYDTHQANYQDMMDHGTHHWKSATRCIRGHELSGSNLLPSESRRGNRGCLACARTRSYLNRHEEMRVDFQSISDSYYDSIMKESAA